MEEKQENTSLTVPSDSNVNAVKDVGIFKVVFNKKKFDVSFDLDSTIAQLKEHLHTIIGECFSSFFLCIEKCFRILKFRCTQGNAKSYGQRPCP